MKIKRSTRLARTLKQIINVRAWSDYDRVRSFTSYIVGGFQRMFVPQQHGAEESFEAAMTRMNLSEDDLKNKASALYRLSMLMLTAAIFILGYAIYHLYFGGYRAVLVSLVLVMIALVLSFRYHFWYYQIKARKLGCTFSEWYRQGLKGEK
ncbi:type IVB secretion system protein IcmV [Legionella jordanis]|uniref:Intracellular multiplication protein IcmV n=1 Tax=Legionella jordanis TaxID=456 RepID=A0A0W0VBQ4_9GAMM|nr:type IVB secretion system protein IcmV [Legionella jordanis]KTD17519.1 intracellular multiplication protein IcmV [Legionella jordanis]RMX05143.1 type IV secretion protein IcmV [Legionella jordanis]VEH13488.1 intracellular multiplication protein IcmV [Legionella jordanis]HAT8714405.1 type IV secretion protein IcmV [Legionella jordanis]